MPGSGLDSSIHQATEKLETGLKGVFGSAAKEAMSSPFDFSKMLNLDGVKAAMQAIDGNNPPEITGT